MDIFSVIKLIGGLAMFLYGIEVMGDGLKNSSGDALKRVLEKVTGNLITGVLTGTCSKCSQTTTVTLPKLNTTDYTKTTTKVKVRDKHASVGEPFLKLSNSLAKSLEYTKIQNL